MSSGSHELSVTGLSNLKSLDDGSVCRSSPDVWTVVSTNTVWAVHVAADVLVRFLCPRVVSG